MPNANKVKHVLVDRDMSQAELARKMGVGPGHVSKIMRNDADVRESTLKRMCRALNCKAEDLW